MKKVMILLLAVICAVSLFGFAASGQKNETPDTEQENIPDNKENTAAETTAPPDTTGQAAKDPGSEIPGAVLHVAAIWDRTQTEQIPCDLAVEKFWEDETNEYCFACMKSQYVIVMDSTSRTRDVVTALKEGLITVETLDKYGIQYSTVPKK